MKIIVLTTETLHHVYFVQKVASIFSIEAVICERNILAPHFETHHSFEDKRDSHEAKLLFSNKKVSLNDICDTFFVDSINSDESVQMIKNISPDIIIVEGTGKVHENVINAKKGEMINFHGGDPEEYRGLDSHLWAIYHSDFNNFLITVHHLNKELDDGDIILQKEISLIKNMKLHELRSYNIKIAVELAISTLDMYQRHGFLISRPQKKKGRYYSFMPTSLKTICLKRFEKYTKDLVI